MAFFRNIVFVAVLAGLASGLVMTALQFATTVPLIIKAESYERAAQIDAHAALPADRAHGHSHEDTAWAPKNGVERLAYTTLANIVTAIGFAFVLLAVTELGGGLRTQRQAVSWGLAGFAVFLAAPGLGLAPELPGMPAAELFPRQLWWTATAVATAAGLALIVWKRSSLAIAVAVVLILCLSKIKSGHIGGAARRELGGKESARPVRLHARTAHPSPRRDAWAPL
jgi:cobalt transporter subunit CbtA